MNNDTFGALVTMVLAALGLAALAYVLMPTAAGASDVCLSKREARHLWPRSHIYWYSSDHCWSNRHGPPRHLKIEPEEKKEKKIKTDPIFPPRAEAGLGAVTWHQVRPFDQAQPIYPPLNLAVPDDQEVWPDLSEFERRFVGVQP